MVNYRPLRGVNLCTIQYPEVLPTGLWHQISPNIFLLWSRISGSVGSLFSDRNEKMGLDGAMVHLEGRNLRTKYVFENGWQLCLIRNVVCLVIETRKWV